MNPDQAPQPTINPKSQESFKIEFKIDRQEEGIFWISAGEGTIIKLQTMGPYLMVNSVDVAEKLRGQGVAQKLYEEALKLAKAEEKKGIISYPNHRLSDVTNHIWGKFKKEGRTKKVRVGNIRYDALLP